MDSLSTTTLQFLAEETETPCVSIFLPLKRGAYDQKAARLELKNLVATARTTVSTRLRPLQTDALLAPAEELLGGTADWTHLGQGSHGLGFFLSPNRSTVVQLPVAVEPLVMVGERFDVVPLLPIVKPDHEFHVLAMSRNSVKLFLGSRHTFQEMHIDDLPENLDDALWYERHQNILISAKDERKELFDRFALHLDRVLAPAIFTSGLPLVLAAVEREVSSFRASSKHPHLLHHALIGNPDELALADLHDRSWELVKADLATAELERLVGRFASLVGTTRRSDDANEIFDAASAGRIDTLLIPQSNGGAPGSGPRVAGGVDDFVNSVAIETLRHKGNVEFVPSASLLEGATVAAIFRWSETE